MENASVRMAVLPALGAKIASVFFKPQQFEVLFQPTKGTFERSSHGAPFQDYDTSGADEMYPTIDECGYPQRPYDDVLCPDHGDLWSIPWQVHLTKEGLLCGVDGVKLPYRFERRVELRGNTIRMGYSVKNSGASELLGLWAFHGLVACDEQTRIEIPRAKGANVCEVLNVQQSSKLGEPGALLLFANRTDSDAGQPSPGAVQPASAESTSKFYVNGAVEEGEASATLNRGALVYRLRFPCDEVPYLGVWVNEGGFKGEYNCALEPATGFYDSLATAHGNKTVAPIPPGATRSWWMEIALEEAK